MFPVLSCDLGGELRVATLSVETFLSGNFGSGRISIRVSFEEFPSELKVSVFFKNFLSRNLIEDLSSGGFHCKLISKVNYRILTRVSFRVVWIFFD